MRTHLVAALLFAACALAVQAEAPSLVKPASQTQVRVKDDRGVTLTLQRPARRIVTLLPSLTETVCALDGCGRLVGTDRYSNWPPEVRQLPKTGGLDDANVERIVSLKPDLVLAAGSTRAIGRLESLGVTVAALEPKTHADVERVLHTVAALLGHPSADAERLWAKVQRELDNASQLVPPSARGQRVYFEVDAAPYAAGPESFVGETLKRIGLVNIVPSGMGPFPKVNPEFVVRAQPDLIVAGRRTLAEMPARPGWAALPALREGHACGYERERFEVMIRPGPRMGEAGVMLAECAARNKGLR
ncbi:MAG TPA: helical backbone metal receptor [Burkholderiaceae bacterium]|nr:helical backbone metal receptor [Burkholderiaceae bacterium]